MKNPIPFLVLCLGIWLAGTGYWYLNSGCCTTATAATTSNANPLLIEDGTTRIASHAKNLLFAFSGFTPTIADGIDTEYAKVASYLKANPNKIMTLTGQYKSDEKNNSNFENLGLARADAIKKHLISLGVPAAQLATTSSLFEGLEFSQGQTYGGINYSFTEYSRNIAIADATAFKAGCDDNFVFAPSSFEYAKPISDKLSTVFTQTADYLKANPNRSIKLTGIYGASEKNTGILANLGLSRANTVKNLLTGMGVSPKQITMDALKREELSLIGGNLIGGVNYSFFDTPKEENRLADVEKRLRANPIVLYFKTGAETLNLSQSQRSLFADLIYYLDNKKGAAINSTGHTDNKGERNMNMRLSRKRAEFVRDYLSKNGINTKQIRTIGQGPDQPIDTNDTDTGRAKNRRVEITLK